MNEISLILPNFPKAKEKRSIIPLLITGITGFTCEGISHYLYNKTKGHTQSIYSNGNKIKIQCNKIIHLEDSMVMYSIYNSETLEKLITTVHKIHNSTALKEKLCQ